MNPNPNRAESIFAAAVAQPAEQRAAYLDEVCGADAELRRRVEALLQADADAGSFLEKPAAALGVTMDEPLREGPGTRIGPYKLLQQIGEGGMGVVYMAEQEQPVRRRVALKIIKPGMDSVQVVARFEAERQALALMDHPNIAKVYDAGATDSGRPFFVMELVYGVPITRFCDDSQLTPRQRLELFVPICQAIQHAHQKGIIHRDIKPSNVLVTMHDDKAVPKVIDFGVAKAVEQRLTERSLFTAFGAVVGTLEYMSPEQAEMNAFGVDTRSDVYSLGVLLYELLTGTTPLERKRLREAAYTEMLRLIKEVEPPRPSVRLSSSGDLPKIAAARKTEPARLSRLLRGEIDWIVMRCLEKDRTRRYESASALARDVERYLHDEAVEACPPSLGYRLSKFARKYRVLLSTAAAFAALLLIASGVSIWLALAAKRAEVIANNRSDEAEAARREANGERDRAQKEWQRAEDAANQAKANAAATGRALDRMTVAKGIQLAEEGNLFAALPWFVKPLERGGLMKEEENAHRTRIACYLRYTPDRPTLRQILFHDGPVTHAAFSPDAKRVLTVSKTVVYVWDVRSGEAIATLRHPAGVRTAHFTPDSMCILAVAGPAVWTWDASSGRPLRPPLVGGWEAVLEYPLLSLPQTPWQFLGNIGALEVADFRWRNGEGSYWDYEFSRDSRRVLISYKHVLRLLDLETGKLIGQWSRDKVGFSNPSTLSPDGRFVLLIKDGLANIHDTATGKIAALPANAGGKIEAVAFSPDGKRALTISKDHDGVVWDVKSRKPLARLTGLGYRRYGRFSPDNRFVACWGGWIGGIRDLAWWDTESGRLVREVADNENDLQGFDWRPDGQQLLRASKGGEVNLWSAPLAADWNRSTEWEKSRLLLRGSPISAAIYAPDGKTILTATENGEARIWDLSYRDKGESINWKELGKDEINSEITLLFRKTRQQMLGVLGFSVTSKIVTGTKTINWPQRAPIERRLPPGTPFDEGAFSPDQSRVITCAKHSVQLWDAMTGRRLGEPLESKSGFRHVAFSPNSRFVVLTEDESVRVLDARTGEPVGKRMQHKGALYAAFSPDGELLVTCGDDKTARLWRTKTSQPIGESLRHDDSVTCAAFSPNGKTVATACLDGTIRIWGVPLGTPLIVLECLGHAQAILFHPNGAFLAAISGAGGTRIWDIVSRQEVIPALGYSSPYWYAPTEPIRFIRDGRFLVEFSMERLLDFRPDNRPVGDLVKLGQLYSRQRLDANGGTVALRGQELQALWRELSAKYPQEFAVSPKSAVQWRIRQGSAAIAFHRRWLAAELAEAGWQPGERGNEDMERDNYLQRLCALASHGSDAEAVAAADALAARWSKDKDTLYNCACVHALAAGAVKDDAALAERYAARAVTLLQQAIKAGYNYGQHIGKDADLDALRRRKDFLQLQKELGDKR